MALLSNTTAFLNNRFCETALQTGTLSSPTKHVASHYNATFKMCNAWLRCQNINSLNVAKFVINLNSAAFLTFCDRKVTVQNGNT